MAKASLIIHCSVFTSSRHTSHIICNVIRQTAHIHSTVGVSIDKDTIKPKIIVQPPILLKPQACTPFNILIDSLAKLTGQPQSRMLNSSIDGFMNSAVTHVTITYEAVVTSIIGIISLTNSMTFSGAQPQVGMFHILVYVHAYQMYSWLYSCVVLLLFSSVQYGQLIASFGDQILALPEWMIAKIVSLFSNDFKIQANNVRLRGNTSSHGMYRSRHKFDIPDWFLGTADQHRANLLLIILACGSGASNDVTLILSDLFRLGTISPSTLAGLRLQGAAEQRVRSLLQTMQAAQVLPDPKMWNTTSWTAKKLPLLKRSFKGGEYLFNTFNIKCELIHWPTTLIFPANRGLSFHVTTAQIQFLDETRLAVHSSFDVPEHSLNALALHNLVGTHTKLVCDSDLLDQQMRQYSKPLGLDLRGSFDNHYGAAFQQLYGIFPDSSVPWQSFTYYSSRKPTLPSNTDGPTNLCDEGSFMDLFPTVVYELTVQTPVISASSQAQISDPNASDKSTILSNEPVGPVNPEDATGTSAKDAKEATDGSAEAQARNEDATINED